MQTILIVEDNPAHMKLAAMLLGKFGYTALQATDAEAGLRLAREAHPDLILMDIDLPGMDGITATRRLKEDAALRDIPVIGQTSFTAEYTAAQIIAAGAVGLIAKPYHYKDFIAAIKAVLV